MKKVNVVVVTVFSFVILAFAMSNHESTAKVLSGSYGANCCKTMSICAGTDELCDETSCATIGAVCGKKTDYHPASSCTEGNEEPGTGCNAGKDYQCWEQYNCLCEDDWFGKECQQTGSLKDKAVPIKKKECQP